MKTLREWRVEQLLSIEGLADKAGVSNKTVVQIEHGRQTPRPATMRKISKAIGVQPWEIQEFAEAIDLAKKYQGVIEPRPGLARIPAAG